jgi:hypothetical protein
LSNFNDQFLLAIKGSDYSPYKMNVNLL